MAKSVKFLLFLTAVAVSTAWTVAGSGITLLEIAQKFDRFVRARPQEKVYLHLDKPLYAAGEDLWFNAYLVSASTHALDSMSKVVYVELFNASRKLIQRRALYSPNGTSHGDFHLADSLSSGTYVIRAYTNNMRNTEEDFFFLKEVTILHRAENAASGNNGLHNAPPVDVIDDMMFFPEGGNLLTNVENRVAFKATTPTRRSFAAEGKIVDGAGKVITTFKSEYGGMGTFAITPKSNSQYYARITGVDRVFALPDVKANAYMVRLVETDAFIKVLVRSNFDAAALGKEISIVAQTRGRINFAAQGKMVRSELLASIPKNKLPSGVAQITVFDDSGVPQCERLVFINHGEILDFSFKSSKVQYTTREKVDLTIEVKDKNGTPAAGNFSMAVYDESKIMNPEKYPMSIADNLLLTSDLKGQIDDPAYYLKDTLPATKRHVDLLMMTHGWRRFVWKSILGDFVTPLPFAHERGIRISGRVLESVRKPAVNSKIKIATSAGDVMILTTDSKGRFYDDGLLYYDSTQLVIETDDWKGRKKELGFKLDPFNNMLGLEFVPRAFDTIDASAFLTQTSNRQSLNKSNTSKDQGIMLEAVSVNATKLEDDVSPIKLYTQPDATIKMKDIPFLAGSILQAIQGRVAGVVITGGPGEERVSIRGSGSINSGTDSGPLFLLDGLPVDMDIVRIVPVTDVASIDILKGQSAAIYGTRGSNGVIAIITKRGSDVDAQPVYGIHYLKYPGFYRAREFYSPGYDAPTADASFPDIRNTLYWNPSITTDASGMAHLSFHTSAVQHADYRIVVEGISSNGIPGTGYFKISVH
jgi:TonB-dependent SusC/RagA subfamily outer membrane receptor